MSPSVLRTVARRPPAPTPATEAPRSELSFPAFRNAWLDQVAFDATLPPSAFRVAWILIKDCAMTFRRDGAVYSYRGQDSIGEMLEIEPRHVRTMVTRLVERGHLRKQRGGKGHPNRMFPTLFDRNDRAGQQRDKTGTFSPFDRNKSVILTGTIVPGNLIEDSQVGESGARRAPPIESSNSMTGRRSRSTIQVSEEARLERAPQSSQANRYQVGQEIQIHVRGVFDEGTRKIRCSIENLDIDEEGHTRILLRSLEDGEYASALVGADGFIDQQSITWRGDDWRDDDAW